VPQCDESKPECGNCIKQDVTCMYSNSNSRQSKSPASTQSGPTASPAPLTIGEHYAEWGPVTAELMHHWTISTSFVFSGNEELRSLMQITVPQMAFQHEHILHMILGTTALHLAHLKSSQDHYYRRVAEEHHQAGLRLAIPLLSNLNHDNCHSIFLFANMCSGYSLAKGPTKGDFLLFSHSGPAEWISLFQGLLPVLQSYINVIQDGPLAPLIHNGYSMTKRPEIPLPSFEDEQLERLRGFVRSEVSTSEDIKILESSMTQLQALFSSRYSADGQKCQIHFSNIGVWLYGCTGGLTTLLGRRNPPALAIFAHSCVVMNEISSIWVMKDWVSHLLLGIHESLTPRFHPWMHWPMQQIGWIPP